MALSWEDRLEIQDLMVRYAAAIDMEDGTESDFRDVFTPDVVLESPLTGHNVGDEGLRRFWAGNTKLRADLMIRHFITNYRITGDGDRASVKAYFIELATARKPRMVALPRKTEFLFSGLYDCVAVKIGGKWLLERRTVFVDAYSPLN